MCRRARRVRRLAGCRDGVNENVSLRLFLCACTSLCVRVAVSVCLFSVHAGCVPPVM